MLPTWRDTWGRANLIRWAVVAGLAVALGACNLGRRLTEVGTEPALAPIVNPNGQPGYKEVSLPMPAAEPQLRLANSLWRPGARAFFRDQRASRVGDLLTVSVTIEEEAALSNSTSRTRTNAEDVDITNLLGYEGALDAILPEAIDPASIVSLGSTSNSAGTGTVAREETVTFEVAAIVTQVLPNGNFVIHGHQEVRVNFEVREILVAGVVRPEDISSLNTVVHTQIAEARISYSGRGQLSDVQQPRYGQQVLDILLPF